MKLLRRDKTSFVYYAYTGLGSDLNEDGLHTGNWKPTYAKPETLKGNISSPSGSTEQTFAGLDIRYSHVLLMDDLKADIRESGYIVWRGNEYDITAVIPSQNVLLVALLQRTKDYGDQAAEPDGEGE